MEGPSINNTNEKITQDLTYVDPKIFEDMKSDQGPTISELNKKGFKVVLYFMRALGCVHCMVNFLFTKGTLEDIYTLYPQLIKLNTYPIIVYKEKKINILTMLNQMKGQKDINYFIV